MQPPLHANQQILNVELLENVHNPRKPPKKIPGMYRRSAVYLSCLHNIPVKCKQSLFTFISQQIAGIYSIDC